MVCPNCGAKYEVDAALIPPSGRDVQCSNCGETWFETFYQQAESGGGEPAGAVDAAPSQPSASHPAPSQSVSAETADAEDLPTAAEDGHAERADDASSEPEPGGSAAVRDEDVTEEGEEPPPLPGKEIEFPTPPHIADSVRQMLKEEATRETIARQDDAGNADSWGKRRTSPLRDKMTQARTIAGPVEEDTAISSAVSGAAIGAGGIAAAAGGMGTVGPTSAAVRRSSLPDVEEINSSLQAQQDQFGNGLETGDGAVRRRGGFGKGFFFVVFLAIVAVVLYALADLISQQVPQVEPWLDAYVAWVDGVRAWIDMQVQGFMGTAE